ncbi:MAG: carboxymuconolactone decarboxylase family protein [Caldimonas sp.]
MKQRLDHQALAPEGMRALGSVYGYVASKSGLPPDLVDLVYLRVSQINGCAFCISSHSKDLLKSGAPQNKLLMLTAWRETPAIYSEKERAALSWAESVTLVAQTTVPEAEYEAAAAQFTQKELVDLTLAVGLINAYNRMAISFRRTPDELVAS